MNHTISKNNILYKEVKGTYSLYSSRLRRSRFSLVYKRTFDIVFSLFVIIFILSWLLPILSICIKLSSRGPVFFRQKRIGLAGRPFTCIKLRTMIVNNDANLRQAQANDSRITSFGSFLRTSCLDEMPQFFNVLIGHMSIVGPRPHMITDCKEFSKSILDYNLRYQVKPGITGMAQVKGYRGCTSGFYDILHRYKWDIFYIRNLSFKLDMKLIGLTISTTFKAIFCKFFPSCDENDKISYQFEAPEYLN